MRTVNEPIWSRCRIAPTYNSSPHFQRTLNRERRGVRMNAAGHQEKERMRRRGWARERKEEREDRRAVLKRLCAVLRRSFSGKHGEKWFM